MAIMTRWRMPPESSCGYWRRRRSGSEMRDRLRGRRRAACARLARPDRRWARIASVSWRPIDEHRIERGHRLLEDHRDVGAADLAHLGARASRSSSRPSRRDRPPAMRAIGSGRRRMIESAVIDLARTGFAGDGERLACGEVEGEVVDDGAPPFGRRHLDGEMPDRKDGGSRRLRKGTHRSTATSGDACPGIRSYSNTMRGK